MKQKQHTQLLKVKGGNLALLLHLMAKDEAWPATTDDAAYLAMLSGNGFRGQVVVTLVTNGAWVNTAAWERSGWVVEYLRDKTLPPPYFIEATLAGLSAMNGQLETDDACAKCGNRSVQTIKCLDVQSKTLECQSCGQIWGA